MDKTPKICPKCGAEGTMKPVAGSDKDSGINGAFAMPFTGAAGVLIGRLGVPKIYQCSKCMHMVEK